MPNTSAVTDIVGGVYPQEGDINKIRSYLTSIQYQKYIGGGRNPQTRDLIVSCTYILYPGDVLHQEGTDNSVGALPLIPGMSASRIHEVHVVLKDLLRRYI